MKKVILFASALLSLTVFSCTKDDTTTDSSASVVRSYQVLTLSGGKAYAKDVVTPTYGPDGRVIKTVYEMYTLKDGKATLKQVELMDFDYSASVAYATRCWELMTPGALSVTGPYNYTLEFDGGGNLTKAIEGDYTKYLAYNGDRLASYKVTGPKTDLTNEYTWSGGDLVELNQSSEIGPYKVTVTYGKESNPFADKVDPILYIYESILPDYSRWNLTGKNSAHLPATYKEDFYADITFSFEYKKDAQGRIVQVDIKGDDKDSEFDKSIIINY
ncbi:MAG: hypothetical protein IJL22_04665 [Bacteroidales bacterium]|nr:hypothetical protein [Bacteroidales bacterium]